MTTPTPEQTGAAIEIGAMLATRLTLDLPPATREQFARERRDGYRACLEMSFDERGWALIYLTTVSPDGVRREYAPLLTEPMPGMH